LGKNEPQSQDKSVYYPRKWPKYRKKEQISP